MARQTLNRLPKFAVLCKVLGLSRATVRGHLELMWDCAHETGNPIFDGVDEVEAAAEWDGPPGRFVEILSRVSQSGKAGWLDVLPNGRYELHHYWDHCPKYVKQRQEREQERRKTGAAFRESVTNGDRTGTERGPNGAHSGPERSPDGARVVPERRTNETARDPSHHPSPITHHTTPSPSTHREEDISNKGEVGEMQEGGAPPPDPRSADSAGPPRVKGGRKPREPEEPLPELPAELASIPGMPEAWQRRLKERREFGAKGKQTASQVESQFGQLLKVLSIRGGEYAVDCVVRAASGHHQGVVFPKDDYQPQERGSPFRGNGSARNERNIGADDERMAAYEAYRPERIEQLF